MLNTKIYKYHEEWAVAHGYRIKVQAPSNKLQAASNKPQAPSAKRQASSFKSFLNINPIN
jgi:hypothetical protein